MYKLNLEKYLDDRFDKESNIKKRQKISEEVTTYYSNINDIVGIILVGSLQGAPRDKFSDFDFFIIYDKRAPILAKRVEFIQDHVGSNFIYSLNYISNEYGISDDFSWDDIEVCTSFYSLAQMEQFIKDVQINTDYKRKGFYYPMAFVAAIAEGLILFEKNKTLTKFKIQCKSYPDNLKNKILAEEKGFLEYYQDRMGMAVYRNDYIYFNDLVNLFIDSTLQTTFAYNKVYFYSKKEIDKKIRNLKYKPDELFNNIAQLIKIEDNIETYAQKKELAKQITLSLEKYNSDLPDFTNNPPANDSIYSVAKKNWLIPVGVIATTVGIAFFKFSSRNTLNLCNPKISIPSISNK